VGAALGEGAFEGVIARASSVSFRYFTTLLPESGMTPDEFRRYGHQLIDWIANYRATLASLPVAATTQPGDVRAHLPAEPPVAPECFDSVIADLDSLIVPGLTHWQHPRFCGYFPANSSLASVLGDLLSTGLGVLGLNWQVSPALTEIEEVVTDWMRQMCGLSAAWSGVIQDTVSTGNLIALLCARERTTNFSLTRGGLQSEAQALTIYVSTQSHSSVEKAALLAGLGRENVRAVPHDDAFALRPDALAEMVQTDAAAGRRPCAVVATTGTTASTALDPIGPIAAIAARHGLWLHVDAAMAGSAMILPECRWMWDGIEQADSLALNPHKWLGVAFDCSLFYVRDSEHLIRVMSTSPSYLQTAADGRVKNYRDWGIALGRRFRALKLWCLIRSEGVARLQARLRRDIDNAHWLADQAAATPGWQVVAPVPLQTICVVHQPGGLTGEALDTHTRDWCERLNRSGTAYLTPTILGGRWVVRVSIGAECTERPDLAAVWAAMRRHAEREESAR
jgi:aromatic-L-amino-acid/L-tryptophan decarboxylase